MSSFAKLRSDLVSVPAEVEGVTVYNIKDPITGSYFRLREPEFWLISQLDGNRSNDEVARKFRHKFDMNISPENVAAFVTTLEKLFFLEDNRAEQAISRASYQSSRKRSLAARILFVKIKAISPGRFLDTLTRLYRPLHSSAGFLLQTILLVIGLGLFAANASEFWALPADLFRLGSLAMLISIVFVMITFHELAHAVVCRFFGGEVKEMGFLLLYFQPCFYTDLSDAWLFPERRHRLAVTWAGPHYQFLVLAAAVIVWRMTIPGAVIHQAAALTATASLVMLLFNLNPLIKLDGYYLLSDWLDIPNLRQKSFAYLGNKIKRTVLGWPIDAVQGLTSRHKRIFLAYATLATVYSVLLISYIVALAARFLKGLMGGAGIVLLFAIILLILRPTLASLVRGIGQHLVYMKSLLKKPVRLIVYLVVSICVAVLIFGVSFPHRVSGEVAVRPIAEFSLMVNDAGLLERRFRRYGANPESKTSYLMMTSNEMANLDLLPFVKDGQTVQEGDTLAVLVSNQVTKELVSEMSNLEKYRGQLALLKSPPKREAVAEAEALQNSAQVELDQFIRELKRVEGLAVKDAATIEQLESAQAAVAIAEAGLSHKRAQVRLLKSPPKPEEEAVLLADISRQEGRIEFLQAQQRAQSIVSPIAGRVVANQLNEFVLAVRESDQIELLVPVSDFDINLIQMRQSVKLKVRSYPDRVFVGEVVHIPKSAIEIDNVSRFPVSVVLPNEDEFLQHGMTGYAKIEVGEASLFNLASRKLTSIVRVEFWSWW